MLYLFSFLAGGLITVSIVFFENTGHPLLSRLAALFPVFTWLSYLFIGRLQGVSELSKHSLFVLLGTIFCWIPYMLTIYYFSTHIGAGKAITLAIIVFLILAALFIKIYKF